MYVPAVMPLIPQPVSRSRFGSPIMSCGVTGTGAIMAVPAHDERDFAFAKKFNVPMRSVVLPPLEWTERHVLNPNLTDDVDDMTAFEEQQLFSRNGTDTPGVSFAWHNGIIACIRKILPKRLLTTVRASIRQQVRYRSTGCDSERERKNGCVAGTVQSGKTKNSIQAARLAFFPANGIGGNQYLFCILQDGTMKPLDEGALPLLLPAFEQFKPSGTTESPLALATDWVETTNPETGLPARRETNTMPQSAGSCWYYLRYSMHTTPRCFAIRKKNAFGCPSICMSAEPSMPCCICCMPVFGTRCYTISAMFQPRNPSRNWWAKKGMILGENSQKMSKSRGNVVNPDDVLRGLGRGCVPPVWKSSWGHLKW